MVAKGKLIRVEDSDGDECFEKAVRSEIQEVEESRQARSSKSGTITQNSFEDLGEAFSSEYANAKIKKRKTEGISAIQDSIPEDKHPTKMKKESPLPGHCQGTRSMAPLLPHVSLEPSRGVDLHV
jgi:hypothetical protein